MEKSRGEDEPMTGVVLKVIRSQDKEFLGDVVPSRFFNVRCAEESSTMLMNEIISTSNCPAFN